MHHNFRVQYAKITNEKQIIRNSFTRPLRYMFAFPRYITHISYLTNCSILLLLAFNKISMTNC